MELHFKRLSALFFHNWDVNKIFLYDEEGLDGWDWDNTMSDGINLSIRFVGLQDQPPELNERMEEIADKLIDEMGW